MLRAAEADPELPVRPAEEDVVAAEAVRGHGEGAQRRRQRRRQRRPAEEVAGCTADPVDGALAGKHRACWKRWEC